MFRTFAWRRMLWYAVSKPSHCRTLWLTLVSVHLNNTVLVVRAGASKTRMLFFPQTQGRPIGQLYLCWQREHLDTDKMSSPEGKPGISTQGAQNSRHVAAELKSSLAAAVNMLLMTHTLADAPARQANQHFSYSYTLLSAYTRKSTLDTCHGSFSLTGTVRHLHVVSLTLLHASGG